MSTNHVTHPTHHISGPHLRPAVLSARERLAAGRAKLREQHNAGSPGIQVCNKLTTLFDEVVVELFHAALADFDKSLYQQFLENIALVPNGGFGRRDSAPYSDIDLMLLYNRPVASDINRLSARLIADLGDAGLTLGFNTRNIDEIANLAIGDGTILTSLAESRFLVGSHELFDRFYTRFRRQMMRRWRKLVPLVEQARREERAKFGETVFLLEPNIKRSRGGLRDLQLIRWIGFLRHGESSPDALRRAGHLSKRDFRKLRSANDFLLRVRNDMHFHAGKANDLLDRSEQMRLAQLLGYEGEQAVLPVERFMQDYFRHTTEVRNVAAYFARRARPQTVAAAVLHPLIGVSIEGDFRLGPGGISATRRGLKKLNGNLAEVLRLMDLANMADKRIDNRTWEAIRQSMMERDDIELTDEAIERFLSLLSQPAQLGDMLRRLHELHVLEKLEPGFKHARNLLQFNGYHKLTVDAHCIRAVEACTEFQNHPGRLGQVYRSIKHKRTLHLALLIHDLGKGFPEDHSEVGARLAADTARRLKLSLREARRLEFLVHKHLVMSHLAFRRDISDEQVVIDFAVQVGSPDRLKMLYVLTAADLAAVGPGVLNDWKLDVLTQLYHGAMRHLAGDASLDTDDTLRQAREKVHQLGSQQEDPDWFRDQIDALSASYLFSADGQQIIDDLTRARGVQPGQAIAWGRYVPESDVVEYTLAANGKLAPGLFHRLTGALTSKRLQILSADINTLADDLVIDRFRIEDPSQPGPPDAHRLQEVSNSLVDAARDDGDSVPNFSRFWTGPAHGVGGFTRLPTQVRFDNDTSDNSTVIDIFAHDRQGLLYAITRALHQCQVSVSVAKIGTYLDQVVDVFYITDRATGGKIEDECREAEIRNRLLEAIDGTADTVIETA